MVRSAAFCNERDEANNERRDPVVEIPNGGQIMNACVPMGVAGHMHWSLSMAPSSYVWANYTIGHPEAIPIELMSAGARVLYVLTTTARQLVSGVPFGDSSDWLQVRDRKSCSVVRSPRPLVVDFPGAA